MSIEMNGAGIGSAAWKLLNTGFKNQRRKGSSDYP